MLARFTSSQAVALRSQLLAGFWPGATLNSLKVALSIRINMREEPERGNASERTGSVCPNLITDVTFHHFCCILLVPSKSLGPTHSQREEYQERDQWGFPQRLPTLTYQHIIVFLPEAIADIINQSWLALSLSPEKLSKSCLVEDSKRPITNQVVR